MSPRQVSFQSPNLNAYVERFIQTILLECLDQFVVLGEKHLDHLVKEFVEHSHMERPHQGVGNDLLYASSTTGNGGIVSSERLGGLLRHYTSVMGKQHR